MSANSGRTASDLASGLYGITQTGTPGNVYSGNTTSTDRMDSRNLAAAMSGEIWFSFLVNVPAAGNWAGLSFDSDLTTGGAEKYSHALSELRVLLTPSALVVDMTTGVPTATGTETGTFAAGSTHLILGKMNIVTGNDTLEIWVDPNVYAAGGPDGLPTANFTSTTVDFMDSVARIGVPNSDSTGNSPGDLVHIDAIWLSDTATAFVDVTGVTGGDTDPPTVSALSPTNGAEDVELDANLVITFNESVTNGASGNSVSGDRMDSQDLTASMSGDIWFTVLVYVPAGGDFAGISFHSDTAVASGGVCSICECWH